MSTEAHYSAEHKMTNVNKGRDFFIADDRPKP